MKVTTKKKGRKQVRAIDMDPRAVRDGVHAAIRLLAKIVAIFSEMEELSPDERLHSGGRLREDEADAMRAILSAAEKYESYFRPFAKRDGGKDDERFEAAPARNDLDRREALIELHHELEKVSARVDDTILVLGQRARDVVQPVYELSKSLSAADPEFKRLLTPATSFYAGGSRKAKRTAKAKNAAGSSNEDGA